MTVLVKCLTDSIERLDFHKQHFSAPAEIEKVQSKPNTLLKMTTMTMFCTKLYENRIYLVEDTEGFLDFHQYANI